MKFSLLTLLFSGLFQSYLWSQGQIGNDIYGEAAGDRAGYSVSMPDANTLAIGSYASDNVNGADAGQVQIYTWDGSSWNQKGADINGEAAGDWLGAYVYMPDPNTVAAGAPRNSANGTWAGRARVYTWDGSSWNPKGAPINGDGAYDRFGMSIAMPDANTLAIGAYQNDNVNGNNASHVRIYTWNSSSSTWQQKGLDINGDAAGAEAGFSVSMPDSNTVALGAVGGRGYARVFSWDGSAWIAKGSRIDGEGAGDQCGSSVSMPDANTLAVGAQSNDGNGSNSGHARVFTWDGSNWIQKGLDIDGEAAGDLLGRSVDMPDANTLAVGAYRNDGNGTDAGHARIYDWNGSSWVQRGIDIDGEAAVDNAAFSARMPDANTVAVGAVGNDGNGNASGHVRVYDLSMPEINLSGKGNSIPSGQTTISLTDNTDFGRTCVDGGTVTRRFIIENTGGLALNINAISSSNPDFSISGAPSSVAGKSSAGFDVIFDPSTAAVRTATITIDNNDADEGLYSFAVEGEGLPATTDIIRGNALSLNGSSQYAESTDAGFNVNTFSLEAWIRPNSASGRQPILSKWNDAGGSNERAYLLEYTPSGNLKLSLSDDGTNFVELSSTSAIALNQWTHVAVTFDNDTARLYINGLAEGSLAYASNLHSSTAAFTIGSAEVGGSRQYFDGAIEEIRISSIALSAAQIRERMHLSLAGCENGLLAYYQANTGSGTTLLDNSGNARDASLVGSPAWISSTVNVGNDAAGSSMSQSLSVPAGQSNQAFTAANLSMVFQQQSTAEGFTVSYQGFTPNSTAGAEGFDVFDNPTWTINKATKSSTQNFDLTFTLPSALPSTDGTKYRLLWRPMYSDAGWALVKGQAASVSGNDITFVNLFETGQYMVEQFSTAEVSDVRGNMYALDGANDCIDIGPADDLEGLTALTVETWLKLDNLSGRQSLIETNDVSSMATSLELASGVVYFYSAGAYFVCSSALPLNEWTHIAATFDGSSLTVYVNGEAQAGTLYGSLGSSLAASFANNLFLGAENGGAQFLNGSMDEVRLWNVVRTQEEIRENMHLVLRGNETGLLRYYQFNKDGAINTAGAVVDASNNNRDGRTRNMAPSAYRPSQVAVAGGLSDRLTVNTTGAVTFPNTGIEINFATNPNAEIVVARLQTEGPTGIVGINNGYEVDDQYYVIRRFGGTAPDIAATAFENIGYIASADVSVAGAFELYKRPSNAYLASDWALANAAGADGTASSGGAAGAVNFPVTYTDFSQLVILNSSGSSTLPVELLHFEAQRSTATQVDLTWSTSTERNASHFEIERMLEEEEVFTKVGSLAAVGNSASFESYTFQDLNAYQGWSYYRLKQVDEDGHFEYSEIRAVAAKHLALQVAVFPNPVKDVLKLRLSNLPHQQLSLQIINPLGQIVYRGEGRLGASDLLEIREVAKLIPGNYYLQLAWEQERITLPFIKQ